MLKYIIPTTLFLLFGFSLMGQVPRDIVVEGRLAPSSNSRSALMCNEAGTIEFGVHTGTSNDANSLEDRIYLCFEDAFTIEHNEDSDLSGDPDASSDPGIGYAFYLGGVPLMDGPTLADIIDNDPNIVESSLNPGHPLIFVDQPNGDATFQNTTQASGVTLQDIFNSGDPVELWFAPITYDKVNNDLEATYEGTPAGPCVDVNIEEAFSVVYLNPISIDNINKETCSGSFTVDGGMPEFATLSPSFTSDREYTIEIVNVETGASATVSGNFEAEGTVNFDITTAGLYTITVSDGKSCSAQATVGFDMTECPQQPSVSMPCPYDPTQLDEIPLAGSVVCADLTTQMFANMASAQFIVAWDTSVMEVLSRGDVMPNTDIPNISTSFGYDFLEAGELRFSWITDNFIDGTTLGGDIPWFTICFQTKKAGNGNLEIIGKTDAADFSPIEFIDINGVPMTFDVTSNICPLEISPPPSSNALQIRADITQPCVGDTNGKLELTIAGGSPPYRLELIGDTVGRLPTIVIMDSDTIIENLAPDVYNYSMIDATGNASITSVFEESFVIREVDLIVNILPEQPKCFGEASGKLIATPLINATIVSDLTDYTFLWSNDSTSQEINNLLPGQYEVTVTNPNGCTKNQPQALGQPRQLSITRIGVMPATCSGSFDGALRASADGGTGQLTYRWDIDTTVNSSSLESLDVGNYQLLVMDENGCAAGASQTVDAASLITLTPDISPITCFGETDASITITRTIDGFPSGTEFTFDWSDENSQSVPFLGNPTGDFSTTEDLGPGTYTVRVTASSTSNPNLSQCFSTQEYAIENPLPVMIEAIIDPTANCRTPDGRIQLEVTGGTGGYRYGWEFKDENIPTPDSTEFIAIALPPDSVSIMVLDENDCLAILDTVITSPVPPLITEFVDNMLPCADDTDGTLQVIAEPGDADIVNYRWSHNASVTGNFAGSLSPDTFIVAVVDANFCETTDTAIVSSPPPISFDRIDTLQTPCFEEANGSLQVALSGGMPNYEYNWLDADNEVVTSNNLILENISSGVYTIKGTDANACEFETSVSLPSLAEIQINFSSIRGTSCFDNGLNERDGEATAMVSYADGTTGEFDFFWPTGQDESVSESRVTNLGSGQIEVLVFESNGICSTKDSVTIPSPERLEVDPLKSSSNNITCNGGTDGSITVEAMGGTNPYTYQWEYQNSTNTTIRDLEQGTYLVTFTDANDCIAMHSVDITEPDPLILDLDFSNNNTSDVVCPDEETGQVAVLASGANTAEGGIIYSWQNNIANGPIATDLAPGRYVVTVTDALGCFDSISYTVNQPPPIQFSIAPRADIPCNGGEAVLAADPLSFSGGNGGTYRFKVEGYSPEPHSLDRIVPVPAGEHLLKVYDSAGCEYEETITINEPLPINIEFPIAEQDGGNLVAQVELGGEIALNPDIFSPLPIADLTWSSSNPADSTFLCNDITFCDNPIVNPLDNTMYTLSIIDQNGCTAEKSILIEVDKNRNIFIPNAFAPNAKGFDLNETFKIYSGVGVEMIEFARVFDRWGQMVASIESPTLPANSGIQVWDGKVGGQRAPQGVYVYIVSITFVDGTNLLYRGDVTVLR